MLGKLGTDGKGRQGITNVDAQHNILNAESFDPYETYPSEFISDKNILKDYETDKTSKRNFFLIANNIPDDQLGSCRYCEDTQSSVFSEKPDTVKLDTIRSGESLIKHFNFDTSKYNSVTNKCIAFWRTLMQTDLQPIKCTLLKGSRSSVISDCEQEEEENSDKDSFMWYKALVELQRRKMDEAAFAAVAQQCKLCEQEDPYSQFKNKQEGKYSKEELQDSEDLICLNYWNPNVKQVSAKKPLADGQKQNQQQQHQQQHTSKEILDSPTVKDEMEPPPLTAEVENISPPPLIVDVKGSPLPPIMTNVENTVHDEDNTSADISQQSLTEPKCGINEQHPIKLTHSDPCICGRARCSCSDSELPSEDGHVFKISRSEPCNCGRAQCACNACEESLKDVHSINESQFESQEENTFSSATEENDGKASKKEDQEQINTKTNTSGDKGILPKCEICKIYCKCWEHKIEMSKQFIDDSKFQLKCQETRQDKSCETEAETVKEEIEKTNQFCIICGHYDCNCKGPTHKQTRKYIEYHEFDDHMITTLLLKKDKSLKNVKSLTNAERISRSALQKKMYEHSKEHICCIEEYNKIPSPKQEEVESVSSVVSTKKLPQKKLFITPEQRAKDITNRNNKVVVKLDKYGIPQLVRYADGRLAPKPTTSEDILSSNDGDRDHMVSG